MWIPTATAEVRNHGESMEAMHFVSDRQLLIMCSILTENECLKREVLVGISEPLELCGGKHVLV